MVTIGPEYEVVQDYPPEEEAPPPIAVSAPSWWELHGTEVAAAGLMLGLGVGIPAILIVKKIRG